MDKKTKIVATIGPASDSPELIHQLIDNGVNIFRFNFKHNQADWHSERMKRVNSIADEKNIPIGLLIDLQGPEIRIKIHTESSIYIKENDFLYVAGEPIDGFAGGFQITHMNILQYIQVGQEIIADDGAFRFSVTESSSQRLIIQSHSSGELKDNKSINIPGADFPFPVLTERDFQGLDLVSENEVDFVALSFVRSGHDIDVLKKEMKERNIRAKVVTKIEARKAIEKLDDIINKSDVVMVARGDLGVELPLEEVPYYQKVIIKKCNELGIPVITATQMLQSMIEMPYPTRAEISDVANATYDDTDAVMLSAESASGSYPLESVKMMAQTVQYNENKLTRDSRLVYDFKISSIAEMICNSAYALSIHLLNQNHEIAGFLVFTHSGNTVRRLSRYRSSLPIFAFAPDKVIRDSLTINYGTFPFVLSVESDQDVTKKDLYDAIQILKLSNLVHDEQKLIVLHGDSLFHHGSTSSLRVIPVNIKP